jgi:hypothetical protein
MSDVSNDNAAKPRRDAAQPPHCPKCGDALRQAGYMGPWYCDACENRALFGEDPHPATVVGPQIVPFDVQFALLIASNPAPWRLEGPDETGTVEVFDALGQPVIFIQPAMADMTFARGIVAAVNLAAALCK